MKKTNNKYEIVAVVGVITFVFIFLAIQILPGAANFKYKSLINSATSFTRAVNNNLYYFENENKVYLDEAIDENYLSNIKSPFSSNNCDNSSSYVEKDIDGTSYTTLKCDSYLLSKYDNKKDNYTIYKVSDWSRSRKSGDVRARLYNCVDNNDGKMLLDNYVEADFFIYKYNKKYATQYMDIKEIPNDLCKIESKFFYRNEVEVEKSS